MNREATLADVLAAREERAMRQSELLARHGVSLVCLTLNIAGQVKVDAASAYAYRVGRERVLQGLTTLGLSPLETLDLSGVAGFCLLMAVPAPAQTLKRLCVQLEEMDALGRLFDMDVIAPDGAKLERAHERCCLVCGKPGRGCASRRVHPVSELQSVTRALVAAHRLQAESERIASLTVQSLLDEVCATPKPGLVDCLDAGSHTDMDVFTFTASAAALHPYFAACYRAGVQGRALTGAVAFERLQALGIEAERLMRRATGGVNTHKGAVFTLGILCAAAGRVPCLTEEGWFTACAELAGGYRAAGVRGEAADGFPSIRHIALPALREAKARGMSLNDACLYTLLHLMARVEDTNMVHRGGEAAAAAARGEAQRLLQTPMDAATLRGHMACLNDTYKAGRLSPGGCADLLAASLLAERWLTCATQQRFGGEDHGQTV